MGASDDGVVGRVLTSNFHHSIVLRGSDRNIGIERFLWNSNSQKQFT
jgi:hypothetical protein